MHEVVRELYTQDRKYKVEIAKRREGLFEYFLFEWTREEVPEYGYTSEWYWSPITKTLSISDSEDSAIKLAAEELRLYSGAVLEF